VSEQLGTIQTSLQTAENLIGIATTDIDELETLTDDIEEIVIDGLIVMGAEMLENWARKAIKKLSSHLRKGSSNTDQG
jgi:hypothetical protein